MPGSKSSVLICLAMKNENKVFLVFFEFFSVPRFLSFLIMTAVGMLLDAGYLLTMLKEDYTIFSNNTFNYMCHQKILVLGQRSM